MASENKTENQEATNPEHINLKVMGQDGNIVQFKIKRHTALKKLMSTYCERAGLALQTIRFSFDGTRINESDTPKSLDMEDGDTIEVFQQQSGGKASRGGRGRSDHKEQSGDHAHSDLQNRCHTHTHLKAFGDMAVLCSNVQLTWILNITSKSTGATKFSRRFYAFVVLLRFFYNYYVTFPSHLKTIDIHVL